MASDTGALIPDLDPLVTIPEDVEEIQNTQNDQLVAADAQVASLLGHPGYQKIADKLDYHIDQFRTGKGMAFDKNTPIEVIGQKYVIASTVANICEEIKEMVAHAAASVAADRQAKADALKKLKAQKDQQNG